jgi:outer membrane protein assembly factor BamD
MALMTNSLIRRTAAAALGSVLLAGCHHRHAPQPLSPDVVYARAQEAYAAHKHGRAATLFQQFLALSPGDPRVPVATYLTGRSHMGTHEYVSAAADFLRVVNDFPSDTLARTARMGLCEAYVKLSPRPALDQEYTNSAIAYCQSYAESFPSTPAADRANAAVRDLQTRLAEKEYDTGVFYFRRKAYDAAVIYFNRAANDYPTTPIAPAALLKLVESYGAVGYVEERDAAKARLARDYPESPEAKSLAAG